MDGVGGTFERDNDGQSNLRREGRASIETLCSSGKGAEYLV